MALLTFKLLLKHQREGKGDPHIALLLSRPTALARLPSLGRLRVGFH